MADSATPHPASAGDASGRSPHDWREAVELAETAGDQLGACDAALAGLRQYPRDSELQYLAVLNTSRAGGLKSARRLWRQFGLDNSADERIAALSARLKREAAFASSPTERPALLAAAAADYETIYRRPGSTTFPGVNAAALYYLAGEATRSAAVATDIAARCADARVDGREAAFNLAADLAAAELILGKLDAAARTIERAGGLASKATSVASTRRQLKQICLAGGIDLTLLDPLRNRSVIHFTGHVAAPPGKPGRFPASAIDRVKREIGEAMDRRNVGYGFGSLACGSDVLFAEALLARHGELDVVLPFDLQSFRRESVETGGPGWGERFMQCLARARVTYATDGGYFGDPEVFAHCSRLAMGTAILASQRLEATLCQIAVWDGIETALAAGTSADIAAWRQRGGETIVIDSGGNHPGSATGNGSAAIEPSLPDRHVRAMIFGDFAGFSQLGDAQTLSFVKVVMGVVGRVLAEHGHSVLNQNTWGDGLFVVLDDLTVAARCALALQREIASLDMTAIGLPAEVGLRIGLHAGPVFEIFDPVRQSVGYAGTHISRTARIEPITPPGEVYVTEQFAALLSLEAPPGLRCDYVGLLHAAKNYGLLRMYLLRYESQI